MNAKAPVEQAGEASGALGRVGCRAIVRFAMYVLLLPMVLFIAAGRWNWVMGWAYFGLLVAFAALSRIIAIRRSPELIVERAQYGVGVGVRSWDRLLVPLVAVLGPLAVWIAAGLDERFGWSPRIPLGVQLTALALVALGYSVGTWAMAVNKFFSAVVRIQEERGHTVVTWGPYRYVRHPAYAGGTATILATPIALGSLWALIPSALVLVGTIIRTGLEDRILLAELDGYEEYARRVHYRLLPGVW